MKSSYSSDPILFTGWNYEVRRSSLNCAILVTVNGSLFISRFQRILLFPYQSGNLQVSQSLHKPNFEVDFGSNAYLDIVHEW